MSIQKSLVIANPCHENWNKMSPTEKGRFCASCTKEVVDFREKTKEDIIDYLENYKGEGQTCGQFLPSQIDKVGKNHINSSVYKRIGISFMAFLGLLSFKEAKGQKPKMGKVAIKGDVSYSEWNQQSQEMEVKLFGSVRTLSGEKIAGAEIKFSSEGKNLGVTKTIANGSFAISLKVDKSMKAIMMYTHAPGYETKINVIPEPQKEKIRIDVIMETEIMMLGQVAIHIDTVKTDSLIKESIMEQVDTATSCSGISTDTITESANNDIDKIIGLPLGNEEKDTTQKRHEIDMIEEKKWLRIFPNPAATNATIEWLDDNENAVEVFDMNGKLVWKISVKGTHTVFNTANLPEGNYLVKITSLNTGKSESASLIIAK